MYLGRLNQSCLGIILHKKSIFKMSKYHPYKANKLLTYSRFIATISERDILI